MQNSNRGGGERGVGGGEQARSVLACLYFDEKLSRELQVSSLLKTLAWKENLLHLSFLTLKFLYLLYYQNR